MQKPNHLFIASMVLILAGFYLLNNYLTVTATLAAQSKTSSTVDTVQDDKNLFAINVAHAQQGTGSLNPTCVDNYQSWPNSSTFKTDVPWSTAMVPPWGGTLNQPQNGAITKIVNDFQRDINGDGIADFVYVERNTNVIYNGNVMRDCVYLSNGAGWEKVYQCVATQTNPPRFYGDCAQV